MNLSNTVAMKLASGETTQQKFTEVYRQLGLHFLNNAERLGNAVSNQTTSVDIFVSINPHELVTVDVSAKELVVKQEVPTFGDVDTVVDSIKKVVEDMSNE